MMPMHFLTTHNDEVLSKKSPQALSADSSAEPAEDLKIYGGKQYNITSRDGNFWESRNCDLIFLGALREF